jgi:hypothetical protein
VEIAIRKGKLLKIIKELNNVKYMIYIKSLPWYSFASSISRHKDLFIETFGEELFNQVFCEKKKMNCEKRKFFSYLSGLVIEIYDTFLINNRQNTKEKTKTSDIAKELSFFSSHELIEEELLINSVQFLKKTFLIEHNLTFINSDLNNKKNELNNLETEKINNENNIGNEDNKSEKLLKISSLSAYLKKNNIICKEDYLIEYINSSLERLINEKSRNNLNKNFKEDLSKFII